MNDLAEKSMGHWRLQTCRTNAETTKHNSEEMIVIGRSQKIDVTIDLPYPQDLYSLSCKMSYHEVS